jgi:hypothetical protein
MVTASNAFVKLRDNQIHKMPITNQFTFPSFVGKRKDKNILTYNRTRSCIQNIKLLHIIIAVVLDVKYS